jgi:hypothetical protein
LFDVNSLEFAKVKQMVIIRTVDIYCHVLMALLGKFDRGKFWKLFFSCSGEFDGRDCWEGLPPEFKLPPPKVAD